MDPHTFSTLEVIEMTLGAEAAAQMALPGGADNSVYAGLGDIFGSTELPSVDDAAFEAPLNLATLAMAETPVAGTEGTGPSSSAEFADVYRRLMDGAASLDDAALLAAVAALASFELPAVDVDAADGQVYVNDGAESRAMDIGTLRNVPTLPLSFTFGLLGSHLIADPTASEEVLLSAKVGIVLDGYSGNVLATVKTGKAPLSLDAIAQCVAVAQERAAALVPLLS